MGTLYIGGSSGGGGGGTSNIQTLTADGTVTGFDYWVQVDASSGNVKVTLPSSNLASTKCRCIIVERLDNSNNTVSIIPSTSTESIDGTVNGIIYLYAIGDVITLTSQGNGDCKITSDKRGGFGGTTAFLSATLSAAQTTNLNTTSSSINHVKFDSVVTMIGNKIILDTSTSYTTTSNVASIGRFTLKAGSIYDISCTMPFIGTSSGNFGTVALFNADTNTQISQVSTWDAGSVNSVCPQLEVSFSPSIDTRVEIKVMVSSGSITSIGSSIYGYPVIKIREASRQSTVLNTVDSVFCYKTSAQSSLGDNAAITWDKMVGNMASASPYVTLKAGKEYEIIWSLCAECNATIGEVSLYAYDSAGNQLPNQVRAHNFTTSNTNNGMASGTGYCKITPSSDIQVQLKTYLFACTSANIRIDGTWLKITQVGSTGTTKVPLSIVGDGVLKGTVNFGGMTNLSTPVTLPVTGDIVSATKTGVTMGSVWASSALVNFSSDITNATITIGAENTGSEDSSNNIFTPIFTRVNSTQIRIYIEETGSSSKSLKFNILAFL